MTFRPEYMAALQLLGEAFDIMKERGHSRPVLVGGAVVEFWTGSDVVSGDFDVVTGQQRDLENILIGLGFERPSGVGAMSRGVIHPKLSIGVEVVSGPLFDGRPVRVLPIDVDKGIVNIISIEEIIADRMGQYNSAPQGVPEMLRQAIYLYRLADEVDEAYLDERIRQETCGDFGLELLKQEADHDDALTPGTSGTTGEEEGPAWDNG